MKKISLIFVLFLSAGLFAQKASDIEIPYFPIDEETKLVTYTDVIQVPGVLKDSLYDVALAWMKIYYKSPSQVIKSQSKEEGMIDIRHQFYVTRKDKNQEVKAGLINYYLTLQFRDGRFKYTITKVNLEGNSYFGIEKWLNEEAYKKDEYVPGYLVQIDKFMMDLIASMESEVRPVAPKKEEDW